MNELKEFFQKTSIKITLLITLVLLSLLALLNLIVIRNSEDAFVRVLQDELREAVEDLEHTNGRRGLPPGAQNFLLYDVNGVERARPLQEEFVDQFQNSLLAIAAIGVVVSFIIGFIMSQVLVQPLKTLRQGIAKLKKNKYESQLEETGTIEIDEVIREVNTLAKKLQQTEELRKDLISDASHELKTPLTSLKGQLEGMKDGILNTSDERYKMLLGQVQRLQEVVERMQEFTRIRNKHYSLQKQTYELRSQLDYVVGKYEQELNNAQISISIEVPSSFELVADKHLLEHVFDNMIVNAIRYSKAENITISAKHDTIEFSDDGRGVPDNALENIFERFYRVDKSRGRETGGTGLGLAIVKEIIEAHGWSISAKNDNGLSFRIGM